MLMKTESDRNSTFGWDRLGSFKDKQWNDYAGIWLKRVANVEEEVNKCEWKSYGELNKSRIRRKVL